VVNGDQPDPLPVAQAAAYIVEILPALGYLHSIGLLFCDFKIDNVIQTQHSLKLIDLGGVYHMDDLASPVYGTVGYQAPEIAESGPSVASDLFTVARTLAVLTIDFAGYQDKFRFTLPPQNEVALLSRFDSLYRFLLKGTATKPEDRFQSADEMAEQLYGVLREVVARTHGTPVPAPSALFTGELRSRTDGPDWHALPMLRVMSDDPAAGFLATLSATDPLELAELLGSAPERTVEVELRLARALIDGGDFEKAEDVATAIWRRFPGEWRAAWYHGLAELAKGHPAGAAENFETVSSAVPGELAPKLALAVTAELAGAVDRAAGLYETVSVTDPGYTSAIFGLARCRLAADDRAGALAAYERVPESSSVYLDAQIARIRCLIGHNSGSTLADLRLAASAMEAAQLEDEQRARLTSELLEQARTLVLEQGQDAEAPDDRLLGHALTDGELRAGLEESYRGLARFAKSHGERIRLVDLANKVRPRTWT